MFLRSLILGEASDPTIGVRHLGWWKQEGPQDSIGEDPAANSLKRFSDDAIDIFSKRKHIVGGFTFYFIERKIYRISKNTGKLIHSSHGIKFAKSNKAKRGNRNILLNLLLNKHMHKTTRK